MKRLLPAVGLLLQIASYVFLVLSLGKYEYIGYGVGRAFAYWIYSVLFALLFTCAYLINSIIQFGKDNGKYNIFRLVAVAVGAALLLLVGMVGDDVCSAVWNIYSLLLLVIAIIDIFGKSVKKIS